MVVKGEHEGNPAATAVETAVIIATETKRRKTGGKFVPGMPGGNFPEDGIEQEARGGARTTASATPTHSRPLFAWERRISQTGAALENFIVFFQYGNILRLAGIDVAGESLAVGGDDDGRLASKPIERRVGRDEGSKDRPLRIGKVGGIIGMSRRKGRIKCSFK